MTATAAAAAACRIRARVYERGNSHSFVFECTRAAGKSVWLAGRGKKGHRFAWYILYEIAEIITAAAAAAAG